MATGKLNLRSVGPSFTVNDVEKSLAWYRDVMGFAVGKRWEEGGKLLGVELTAGPVLFMIGQDDWKKGRDREKGVGFRLYCDTDQDVDELAKGIKARGGTLLQEPWTRSGAAAPSRSRTRTASRSRSRRTTSARPSNRPSCSGRGS